uniref:Uncharacterized protein n=1 Tax=Oryza punctata TaxID=4537 RepID=A0A0E0KQE6_ORYPU
MSTIGSRFVLAHQVLEHIYRVRLHPRFERSIVLIVRSLVRARKFTWSARQPTPIPLAQPRLGLWPAAVEQAVERLLMRMVEDGHGRARAGRGRRAREWRDIPSSRLDACVLAVVMQGEAKWTSG